MPAANIYLNKEDYKLHEKMTELDRGAASQLYANALKEYFTLPETLEGINKKLAQIDEEKASIKVKEELLQKRKNDLQIKEQEKLKLKETLETLQKVKKAEQKETFFLTYLNLMGREATEADYDRYENQLACGQVKGILQFIKLEKEQQQ